MQHRAQQVTLLTDDHPRITLRQNRLAVFDYRMLLTMTMHYDCNVS